MRPGFNSIRHTSFMSTPPSTLRSYAELLRVSNLPTVVPNVLTGCALGAGAGEIPWQVLALCTGGVALLYAGGMALNDAADAEVDQVDRPERPIPSGRISRGSAYKVAATALTAGWVLLAATGGGVSVVGSALVIVIVAYDLLHQLQAWKVVLMGLARGLVYVACAAAVACPLPIEKVLWFAAAITLYTLAFTLVARAENETQLDARRWIGPALPVIAVLPGVWIVPETTVASSVAAVLLVVWQARAVRSAFATPPQTKKAVLCWISGFCLLDVFFLNVLGWPGLSFVALACFAVTVLLHRRIAGT